MDRRTVEVLCRWREHQVEERRTWGAAWQDTGLLFTREDGSQLHPDSATTVFEQLHRRFGIVPEWVIDASISDCAFRLYAVLLRYGQTSGQRMPSRALLARRLHKSSKDTVDRAEPTWPSAAKP